DDGAVGLSVGVVRATVLYRELEARVARVQAGNVRRVSGRRTRTLAPGRTRNRVVGTDDEVLPATGGVLAVAGVCRDRMVKRQNDLRGVAGLDADHFEVCDAVGIAELDVLCDGLLRDVGNRSLGERERAETHRQSRLGID